MKTIERIKADPRVADVFFEIGNFDPNKKDWWIYLKAGFCAESELHTIHEQTITGAYRALKAAMPCTCRDCVAQTNKESGDV